MGKHPNQPIDLVYETAGNVITDALELLHSNTSHGIALDLDNIIRKAGPLALKIDAQIVRKDGPTDDEAMDAQPRQKIENVIGPKDPSVLERLLPSKRGPLSGHDINLGTAKYMMATNEITPYTQFTNNYASNILPHETPNTMTNIPLMVQKMKLTHDDLRKTIAEQDAEIKKLNEEQAQEAAAIQKQIDAMNIPPDLTISKGSDTRGAKINNSYNAAMLSNMFNIPTYKNPNYQPSLSGKIDTKHEILDELEAFDEEDKNDLRVKQKEGELQVAKAKQSLAKIHELETDDKKQNEPLKTLTHRFPDQPIDYERFEIMKDGEEDPGTWIERLIADREANKERLDETMRTKEEILRELEDLAYKSRKIDQEIARRTFERERMDDEEDRLVKIRDDRLNTELVQAKKYYDDLANRAIQRLNQYTVEELPDDDSDARALKMLTEARNEQYKRLMGEISQRNEEPSLHHEYNVSEASEDSIHADSLPLPPHTPDKHRILMPAPDENIKEDFKSAKRTPVQSVDEPAKKRTISNPATPDLTPADTVLKDIQNLVTKTTEKANEITGKGFAKNIDILSDDIKSWIKPDLTDKIIKGPDNINELQQDISKAKQKLNALLSDWKDVENDISNNYHIDREKIEKGRQIIAELKEELKQSGIEQSEIDKALNNADLKLQTIINEALRKSGFHEARIRRIKQNNARRLNTLQQAVENKREMRRQKEHQRAKNIYIKTKDKKIAMRTIKANREKKRRFQPGTYKKDALHGDERSESP